MCFPHIINICVQHIVEKFTDYNLYDEGEEDDTLGIIPIASVACQTYDEAVDRDPIALCRNIVRTLRASGQRRDKFLAAIENGNTNKYFKVNNKAVIIKPRELLLDVRTRWDSVFQMIRRAREMRPVSHDLSLRQFTDEFNEQAIDFFLGINKDLMPLMMTEVEWGVLLDFEIILHV
jgi:hypothetical protein